MVGLVTVLVVSWWALCESYGTCEGRLVDLSVLVCCAGVRDRDDAPGEGRSDPYCRVSCGGASKTTSTKHNDDHPQFNSVLHLGCVAPDAEIGVHCFDKDEYTSDDSLLNEHLQEWWGVVGNGETVRLGGSSWVEIAPIWTTPAPTPCPTASAGPTAVPTPAPTGTASPTGAPSPAPTTSAPPSPAPSATAWNATVRGVQYTTTRLFDDVSGASDACFDSPVVGRRVAVDAVISAAFDDGVVFLAAVDGDVDGLDADADSFGFDGLKLRATLLAPDARARLVAGRVVRVIGDVLEDRGETVLAAGRVLERGRRGPPAPRVATTGTLARSCGPAAAEAVEGAVVAVTGRLVSSRRDVLFVDDGSGPARVVASGVHAQPDDVLTAVGAVVYAPEDGYSLRALSVDAIDPEPPTPSPARAPTESRTRSPTSAPTKRPSATALARGGRRGESEPRASSALVAALCVLAAALLLASLFIAKAVYETRRRGVYGAATDDDADAGLEMAVVEAVACDDRGPLVAEAVELDLDHDDARVKGLV